MNKIIILHRDDLYGLTRNEPIANIVYESFPDPLLKFLDADFIAFEDDRTGLLKILKNNFGACVVMPCASFYTAIQLMTRPEAMNPPFLKDQYKSITEGTVKVSMDGTMTDFEQGELQIIDRTTGKGLLPAANYKIEIDPYKQEIRDDRIMALKMLENAIEFTRREPSLDEFQKEVMNMSNYYGENLVVDFSYLIDQEVASAFTFIEEYKTRNKDIFPESLLEAIHYFNPKFDNVFKIMFQNSEIYFTSTLQISYPELYAEIKKECGFWCKDTPLYKDLLTYGGDHEEFMINTLLKAIFRFRTMLKFDQIKSLDHLI